MIERLCRSDRTRPAAALVVPMLGEPVTVTLLVTGGLMAVGLGHHLAERHEHEHAHEKLEHEHRHVYDEHHKHSHNVDLVATEPHTHRHRHAPLVHRHPHYPDLHHRHKHGHAH